MDSVSANFFVDVFRALPIDFVREFAPHFGSSRFGLESRRFAANYRWRCLQVLWHADDELLYCVQEQAAGSGFRQPVDVANFYDLSELQFDSIQLIGGAAEKKRGPLPDFPVYWSYGPGWVKESDENAIISVIQKSAIAKCHVEIRDYNEFTSRHFLEPIFDRIVSLECVGVGQVTPLCDQDPRRMESFLRDLAQNGKLEKVQLRNCSLTDPNVFSSLIRCCSDSEIMHCGYSTLESAKNRFRELFALAEERRPEPWSAVYVPLITSNINYLRDFFVAEGFQSRRGNKLIYTAAELAAGDLFTKTVGGIKVNFGTSFPCIAVGCDVPVIDPLTGFPMHPEQQAAHVEAQRRHEEVEKKRVEEGFKRSKNRRRRRRF